LTLQGGRLRSTSLRNEASDDRMRAMLGRTPQAAFSDAFNYAGGDYAFNGKRTSFGLWYAQLEDIYNQRYIGLKHSEPLGDWVLGANLGKARRSYLLYRLSGHVWRQRFSPRLRERLASGQ